MDLILKRIQFRQDGILGELSSDNSSFVCNTLEHAYPNEAQGFIPKLPTGLYTCLKGLHRLPHMTKPFTTFEVMDVPGHTGILFHVGNFNNDSEGCVLLGEFKEPKDQKTTLAILDSKKTFDQFMKTQGSITEFVLTVLDHNYSEVGFA